MQEETEGGAEEPIPTYLFDPERCRRNVQVLQNMLGIILEEHPAWGWAGGIFGQTRMVLERAELTIREIEKRGKILKDLADHNATSPEMIHRWAQEHVGHRRRSLIEFLNRDLLHAQNQIISHLIESIPMDPVLTEIRTHYRNRTHAACDPGHPHPSPDLA